MPEEVRNLCRLADISSKSLLLQVVRQETPEKMIALIEKIASQGGATRQQLREAAGQAEGRAARSTTSSPIRPPTKAFNLKLQLHQEPRVAATKSSTRSRRSSATLQETGSRGHARRGHARRQIGRPRPRDMASRRALRPAASRLERSGFAGTRSARRRSAGAAITEGREPRICGSRRSGKGQSTPWRPGSAVPPRTRRRDRGRAPSFAARRRES